MILFALLIPKCLSQPQTSINTCSNEKKVFKLDIRDRVEQLQSGSKIENIDAYALCQEAFDNDYIWLHQLWTPSKYNYKNVNGIPQQTNNYRELENIKEYQIDPVIGTLTNLYKFQQNVKTSCLHIKFLGEFSFYVPKDSYLMQNITRFLRKPLYANPNIYSGRYDDENFLWAFNDQMKTVPYAVPWNYFTTKGIQDMLDVIYRVIITGHKLDGIVFLQPSLGLYKFITQYYYFNEIFDQAEPLLTKIFIKILNQKAKPLIFILWEEAIIANLNHYFLIFYQSFMNSLHQIIIGQMWITLFQLVNKRFSLKDMECMYSQLIVIIFIILLDTREMIDHFGYYPYTYLNDPDRNASFNYKAKDIVEVQFEPQSYLLRYKKLYVENSQQASTYTKQDSNYTKIVFQSSIGYQQTLQIAFPFMFSATYKHQYQTIMRHQHIQLTGNDPAHYYFAQIEPSINQIEQNFTLNFFTLYITPGKLVGIGVCDRDRMDKNGHRYDSGFYIGLGAYILFSSGYQWHNQTGLDDVNKGFSQGQIISVTYKSSNNSLIYYKNSNYLHSFQLLDKVKNLNFCVAMNGYLTTVSLEY